MGAPTHRLEIRKEWQGHNWSNDYLVEGPSMDAVATFGLAVVDFEQTFHNQMINFVYVRTSTIAIGDRTFRHVVLNQPGEGSAGTTNFLPLYCTLRVDLQTADSDPCRKYYRYLIDEADQSNGVISPAKVAALQVFVDAFIMLMTAETKVVSGAGHNVVDGTVYPGVQMRQLHRHKRPALP